MAENKTKQTDKSVEKFLKSIENQQRREDSLVVLELMKKITKLEPKMWGDSIVGFGSYHYKYESGREGDWLLTGFSPRKQNLAIYIISGFEGCSTLMEKLGKHKASKSCLYINKLEDVDLLVLTKVIKQSFEKMKKTYK